MAERGTNSAGTPRMSTKSPMVFILLLVQSHLGFEVVVAAGLHQRYYNYNSNYYSNDNGSRWTTTTSPVTSSAFVFRDCGKHLAIHG